MVPKPAHEAQLDQTGKTIVADYFYNAEFEGDRFKNIAKIWNYSISLH